MPEFQTIPDMIRRTVKVKPLVHCINNYVTINDCANMLLACGGSPIMADDPAEAKQITALCKGLVLNLGMPNARKTEAMRISGSLANRMQIPVVFDPVGVGASDFRKEIAEKLLADVHFAAIRGNLSEIKSLCGVGGCLRGVDANPTDLADVDAAAYYGRMLAKRYDAIVVVSGAVDVISDAVRSDFYHGGSKRMAQLTGSGCMQSVVMGAYLAANPQESKEAVRAAVLVYAAAGKLAEENVGTRGCGSYRTALFDAVEYLTSRPEEVERRSASES